MSETRLRSVSSPPPSIIAFVTDGVTSASQAARNRVPSPRRPEGQRSRNTPAISDPAGRQHRRGRSQVNHDRNEGQSGPAAAVPASFGALRHDDISSDVQGLPGFFEVGHLYDQHCSRPADRRDEGPGITKGQHHGMRVTCQRASHRDHVGRPALEPHAPGLAGVFGGDLELLVQPARILAAATDQPQPPPWETAAASAPPDAPPMGAGAMGCCNEKNSVNAVRKAMNAIIADPAAFSQRPPVRAPAAESASGREHCPRRVDSFAHRALVLGRMNAPATVPGLPGLCL